MQPARSGKLLRRAPRTRRNPTVYASEEYPGTVVESESQDSFAVDISDLSMDSSEKPSDESDDANWVNKLSNAPPLMKQPMKQDVKSVEQRLVHARSLTDVRGGKNARETTYRFPERSTVVGDGNVDRRRVEQKSVPKTCALDEENDKTLPQRLNKQEEGSEDAACSSETDMQGGSVERLTSWYERIGNAPPLMDETLASSQKEGDHASITGATGSCSSAVEATLPDATDEQWRWVQATVLEPDGPLHEPVVSSLAHVVSTESLSLDSREDGTVTPGGVFLATMEDLRNMIAGLLDRLLNFLRDRVTLNCKAEAPTEVEKKLSLDVVSFLNAMSSLDLAITGENSELYADDGNTNDSYKEKPLDIPEHPETKPRTDMNILERLMAKLNPKTVQEQYAETFAEGNHSSHRKKRSLLSEYAVWLKAREKASCDRDVNQNTGGARAPKFPSLSYFIDKIRGRAKDDIEMGTVDLQLDEEDQEEKRLTEKLMRRALEEERRLRGLLRRLMVEMKEDVRDDPRRTSSEMSAWSTSSVLSLINTLAAKMVEEVCVALTHSYSGLSASIGSVTGETSAERKAFTEEVMKVVVTLATKQARAKIEAQGANASTSEDSPPSTPDISTDDVADLAVGLWYGDAESDVDSLIGDLRSMRDSLVASGVDSTEVDGKPTVRKAAGARRTEV
ncbi:uncharacterized protein LOC118417215 isoform X2 [Branchiostoma floridae]|uniref:Uncharacterized protein LOC118417215 isoform X2 n=1 Tax=Branchiostoma floridae TaxID=7739 RepID=A0A9J7LAI8_BRAFL|nr:uncharacterized protein LOC118417215 isoform X2 [Branchiostoma floridae]